MYNKCKKVGNLPVDFGEKEAEKSMESLNKKVNDILQGDQEDSDDSYQFNESFIKTIKDREKQKSIEITDLNQLFEEEYLTDEEAEYCNKMIDQFEKGDPTDVYKSKLDLYFEKLTSVAEDYNIGAPKVVWHEEDIFDSLFIIRVPEDMTFKEKRQIWKEIEQIMHDYSEENGLSLLFYKSSIVLVN